ncbi:hypothetical protein [Aneurinibacillus tyrosinisolvens]|uniref:hypothetical protein n=1 Tax=Aneurinibacillus tyrosinisolvens TaxID=1443435 RepID=UPI00063F9BC9|nr:hypothetical protein [Aneurinibacillus tyrosinisolvens]
MKCREIKMENLQDAIKYFGEGKQHFPLFFLEDDKKIAKPWNLRADLIMEQLPYEVSELLNVMEYKKAGVFFYPNGNTQDKHTTHIEWHYIDIDAENGGTKEEQWERIQNAPLQPTMVYRGRAGHKLLYRVIDAYWDTSSSESIEKSIAHYKNIQQQLIEYFRADAAVINPAHAFRLPFVNNYKYWGEKVYIEELISFNPQNVYSQQQLREAFPLSQKKHVVRAVQDSIDYPEQVEEILEAFVERLGMGGLAYRDYGDRIALQCPIHGDSHPSAYLYKDNKLIVQCSKGRADGGCEIENGKPIGWVAERLGWDDVTELYEQLLASSEEKYFSINISDMLTRHSVHLQETFEEHTQTVEGISEFITEKMKGRGITMNPQIEKIHKNMSYHALESHAVPLCIPLPPGGGKTTWMSAFLSYQLEHDLDRAGAIIVVERVETAKEIAATLGTYDMKRSAPSIDVDYWEKHQAAYVMESAFTSDYCVKNPKEYVYGFCRGCEERFKCPTSKKYEVQIGHPIVILSHARLVMDKDKLKKYSWWVDANGIERKRKLLIIDEKPPMVSVDTLELADILEMEYQIRHMSDKIEDVDSVISMLEKIKDIFLREEERLDLNPINPDYCFTCKSVWYKHYIGKKASVIEQVELLIRKGGIWYKKGQGKDKIYIYHTNEFHFELYNTLILDGTSNIDMEYRSKNSVNFLAVPLDVRSYSNLSFYVADISSGKHKIQSNDEHLKVLAKEVKTIATVNKTLVLCYKNCRGQLESILSEEIEAGKVVVNHFGNVKGSNDYVSCNTIFLAGVVHKGDPSYVAKYIELYDEGEEGNCNTIRGVRRFRNLELEKLRLNDQLTSLIQDICRIVIRNCDYSDPVKVYLPSRDKVLVTLLTKYFHGSSIEEWKIEEFIKLPPWYEKVRQIFEELFGGQVITKKEIKNRLQMDGESGGRNFRRIQEHLLYQELLIQYRIIQINNRMYIKET